MKTIQGSIPAILSPMQEDGALDLPGFERLLDWHIAEGTDAVVVVGTYLKPIWKMQHCCPRTGGQPL